MAWLLLGGLLLAALNPVTSSPLQPAEPESPFQYDWHRLRVAGLVVAAVLCALGVIVLLSGKCKCGRKGRRCRPPPETSHLVPAGAASTC